MNKFELIFGAILVPIDFLVVLFSGLIAYNLRISDPVVGLRPIVGEVDFVSYFGFVLFFASISVIVFAFSGLYSMKINKGIVAEFYALFSALSTTILFVILYVYFFERTLESSRFLIIALWIISIFLVFLVHRILRYIQKILIANFGLGVHKVVVIGTASNLGSSLVEILRQNKFLGYEVVEASETFKPKRISALARQGQINEVIVCDPHICNDDLMVINEYCDVHKLGFYYTPSLFDAYTRFDVRNLAGIMLFQVKRTTLEGWGKIWKRIFDIVFSLFAIVVFAPLMIVVALVVILDSRGNVLYANERIGEKGKNFFLYKFRTMYQEMCTDENDKESLKKESELIKKLSVRKGPLYKIKDDPRVTRVGKFLRKTSLDELPQFFNVLRGEMSVVGPRPHQPREVAKYSNTHKKVLTIKPGITGMAQVNGRSDLSFDEEVVLDTFYIENWSLLTDIIIIMKTPFAMISRRKVD
jgi:exopolysaccharide biosynthesis polyprenyl glycosylphosphotransferase